MPGKLSSEQIRTAKLARKRGKSIRELAREFGVTASTMHGALSRKPSARGGSRVEVPEDPPDPALVSVPSMDQVRKDLGDLVTALQRTARLAERRGDVERATTSLRQAGAALTVLARVAHDPAREEAGTFVTGAEMRAVAERVRAKLHDMAARAIARRKAEAP